MKITEEIEIFDRKLLISQRSIKDIIDASNFLRDNPDPEEHLFLNGFVVHCGLKVNIDKLPKPEDLSRIHFIKRFKRKKAIKAMEDLISVKSVMMKLSIDEILPLVEKIQSLDYGGRNGSSKKKVEAMPT